jgi:hypothetical protein
MMAAGAIEYAQPVRRPPIFGPSSGGSVSKWRYLRTLLRDAEINPIISAVLAEIILEYAENTRHNLRIKRGD